MTTPLLTFGPTLETGVPALDEDHRALVALANRLHELHSGPYDLIDGVNALSDLAREATRHFGREEAMMREHGYPLQPEHQTEHRNIAAELEKVLVEYAEGHYRSTEGAIENYFKFWILDHVSNQDMKLGEFLRRLTGPR